MCKKRVAILQSNYIPWKGYFDMIASVDVFVLYDEVQYTRQDWRNRNKLKTQNGVKWISLPVTIDGLYQQLISETLIADNDWSVKHWAKIENAYRRSPYFKEVSEWLKPLYLTTKTDNLSELNEIFIKAICKELNIATKIVSSRDLKLIPGQIENLVNICKQLDAVNYISGPAGKSYIDELLFSKHGVSVEWFDYSGYKEYEQLWGDFDHYVTILDLFFSVGPNAVNYMKHTV